MYINISIYKQGLSWQNTQEKSSMLQTEQKYICEGYQKQQPIAIARCFMSFTNSVKWSHLGQIPNFKKIDLGQLLSNK